MSTEYTFAVCEERNRLLHIHQIAQREECDLGQKLGRLLVSANRGVSRTAKNDLERARRRTSRTFQAFINHQQKHGCG
jgi:hypothetical protein